MEFEYYVVWHKKAISQFQSVFLLHTLPLIIACVSAALNLAGIVAICGYKKKTNQNIILTYMSTSQILMATNLIIFLAPHKITFYGSFMKYFTFLQWVLGSALVSSMYTMIIDRLICFSNPLKYKSRLPRRRIKWILTLATIFALFFGGVVYFLDHWFEFGNKGALYISLSLIIVYIALFFAAYGLAFYSLKKSNRRFSTSSQTQERQVKKYAVPGVILTSYLLFYCIPFMAIFYDRENGRHRNSDQFGVVRILSLLGFVVDPLTYIFLSKQYRTAFAKKFVSLMYSISTLFKRLNRPCFQARISEVSIVRKEIINT